MTLIDHRILVAAPPQVIWELVGDLSATPKWHVNCSQASVLNTRQSGPGTRCRLSITNGPDIVFEIVSWVENFGYEYTVVDGPYSSSLGRIRLRALPQGTAVQWTFEYELGGPASGLRDALFTRQRLNNEIEQSLKRLKKVVEATGVSMTAEVAERVAMHPAPTAEERAVLAEKVTRTQPAVKAVPPPQAEPSPAAAPPVVIDEGDLPPPPRPAAPTVIDEGDLPPLPGIEEPPLDDEDTRPGRAAAAREPVAPAEAVPPTEAPDEIAAGREPEPPTGEEAAPEEAITQPAFEAAVTRPAVEPVRPAAPAEADHPASSMAETLPEMPPIASPESPGPVEPPAVPEPSPAPIPDYQPAPSLFEQEIKPLGPSIWDVFGMKPPSQAEAATDSEPGPAAPPDSVAATPARATQAGQPRLRSAHAAEGLRRTLNRRRLARIGQLPLRQTQPKKKKTGKRRSSP